MKDLIVTCGTLENEVKKVLKNTHYEYDIKYMEPELHNFPDRLRDALQDVINNNTSYRNILLVYGCCGNALIGLKSVESTLIIPKTDDCISLMLSNNENYHGMRKQTYFLTKSWIEGSKSLFNEFKHLKEKYGTKRALSVMRQMFKHYKYLMLIDNGTYDVEEYLPDANLLAEKLDLELIVEKGNLDNLEEIVTKKWGDNFIIVKKGNKVEVNDFYRNSKI